MAIRKVRVFNAATSSYQEVDIGAISDDILMSDDNTETLDDRLNDLSTEFTGTDGTDPGTKGMVPAPATTDDGKFLKADGTWGDPAGGVTSVNGETGDVVLGPEDIGDHGVAELDAQGKVLSSQLPSFVDDVIEGYYNPENGKFYTTKTGGMVAVIPVGAEDPSAEGWYELINGEYVLSADTEVDPNKTYYEDTTAYSGEITGETGKIYIDKDTNKTYRWSGSIYVEISASLALGETSSTAYRGDRGKTAYDHATDSNKVSTATPAGLYKVGSTAEGHISELTQVTKTDITNLGIPGTFTSDTMTEVDSYTDGVVPTFTIAGDTLTINPGTMPVLATASQTVLTSAT